MASSTGNMDEYSKLEEDIMNYNARIQEIEEKKADIENNLMRVEEEN